MQPFKSKALIILIFLVLCATLLGWPTGDARAQQSASAEVDQYIEDLKDKGPTVRRKAAATLGNMGSEAKAVVPALIEALKDKDPGVRREAAYGLGRIGPEAKAAVPALIEALKDKDGFVRERAMKALGSSARRRRLPFRPLRGH